MEHPHNKERGTLILNSEGLCLTIRKKKSPKRQKKNIITLLFIIGGLEPPAAPRLSRTPGRAEAAPLPNVGEHTIQVLQQVQSAFFFLLIFPVDSPDLVVDIYIFNRKVISIF